MALLGLPRQLVTLIKINHTAGLTLRLWRGVYRWWLRVPLRRAPTWQAGWPVHLTGIAN